MQSNLDDAKISGTWQDVAIESVLESIARRLDVGLAPIGNTWVIGEVAKQDRLTLTGRCGRIEQASLQKIMEGVISKDGAVFVDKDGSYVVSDVPSVITSIRDTMKKVTDMPINSWVIQYYIVGINNEHAKEIGLDPSLSGALSYSYNNVAGNAITGDSRIFDLTASINYLKEKKDFVTIYSPMLVCLEGRSYKQHHGTEILVKKRTIDREGNITDLDNEIIPVGLDIRSLVREVKPGIGILDTTIELSTVVSINDGLPIREVDRIETSWSIKSAGVLSYFIT